MTTVLAIVHPARGGPAKAFLDRDRGREGSGPSPPSVDENEVTPILTGDPLPNDRRRTSAARARSSEEWGRPWLKALRTEEHFYLEYKIGERDLYDIKEDPYEPRNLYAKASSDLKRGLEEQLDALRQCSAEGCRSAEEG